MPQNPDIVASKTASGVVRIFNTTTEVETPISLIGHDKEGYGLAWSRLTKGLLGSGSDDGKICCWNIDGCEQSSQGVSPLVTFDDRNTIIEVALSKGLHCRMWLGILGIVLS